MLRGNTQDIFRFLFSDGSIAPSDITGTADGFFVVCKSIANLLSAIRADMSAGDTELQGPAPFYRENSKIVKRQQALHRDDICYRSDNGNRYTQ